MRHVCLLSCALALLLVVPLGAAGPDAYKQVCNAQRDEYLSVFDFTKLVFGSAELPAIPQDFFFAGSEPFVGDVSLTSAARDPERHIYDLALVRDRQPDPRAAGRSDTVGVRVAELLLQAQAPIQVTGHGGQKEAWLLSLSVAGEQPQGSLVARFDSRRGGHFSATIPYLPRLTFVRLQDVIDAEQGLIDGRDIAFRELDFAAHGWVPLEISLSDVPFATAAPWKGACTADRSFYPGIARNGASLVISDDPFRSVRHVVRAVYDGVQTQEEEVPVEQEPEPAKKKCEYKQASGTPGDGCAACPAAPAPFKGNSTCTVLTDCVEWWHTPLVRNCAGGGTCAFLFKRSACKLCSTGTTGTNR